MSTDAAPYNAQLLKGGLLFDAMRPLVLAYDPEETRDAFWERIDAEGILAGMSERRRRDVLMLFYSRYVATVRSFPALAQLLERTPPKTQALLLYLHAAQGDALLGAFVRERVLPAFYEGKIDVDSNRGTKWVSELLGDQDQEWSESSITRTARNALSLLRDAGLLEGIKLKRIKFPYVPTEVAAYLVYHLRDAGFTTGKRVLEHPDWQLLLQRPVEVEAILARVAEAGLIRFAAAGSLYRLEHLHESLEGVADALVH